MFWKKKTDPMAEIQARDRAEITDIRERFRRSPADWRTSVVPATAIDGYIDASGDLVPFGGQKVTPASVDAWREEDVKRCIWPPLDTYEVEE